MEGQCALCAFLFLTKSGSSFKYFFYSFVKFFLLHVVYRRVFRRLGVPAFFCRTIHLRICHLESVAGIMFSVGLRLSIAGSHLSIGTSDRAPETGWPHFKRFVRWVEIDFIFVGLFFCGSSHFVIGIRLADVSRVGRHVLTCIYIFVTIRQVIVLVIPRCIGLVKVSFLIVVLIGTWTIAFTISIIEVVFIKGGALRSKALLFWTASTVNTFYTFFFRIFFIESLFSESLSFGFAYESESKDVAIGIKESEWRILFVIKELDLQYLSVEVDGPTELVLLLLFERSLHQFDAFWG